MRKRDVALGLLLVAGVILYGWGTSVPEATLTIHIEGPIDQSAVDAEDVVAYQALSSEDQRAFDEARTGDGSANLGQRDWGADVVEFDDEYYNVQQWGSTNAWRIVPIGGGSILAILAGAGLVGVRFLNWFRESS